MALVCTHEILGSTSRAIERWEKEGRGRREGERGRAQPVQGRQKQLWLWGPIQSSGRDPWEDGWVSRFPHANCLPYEHAKRLPTATSLAQWAELHQAFLTGPQCSGGASRWPALRCCSVWHHLLR